ncbi:MAG: hypothetical protein QOE06_652 [Thermoleophilaceae bacterium]|nr:hypothetical protein [Thermoleophilaceae bacterium]
MGGTSAHVIVEEAPRASDAEPGAPPVVVPWLLSAKSPEALAAQAQQLQAHAGGLAPVDVAHTLARRARLDHRAVVVGTGREELLAGLDALAAGEPGRGVVTGRAGSGKTAFMFTGQGAQRVGMGRELHEAFPVFAEAFDAVAAAFEPLSIAAAIWPQSTGVDLDRTENAQPALFAIEVALFRLVESFGLKPDYLIGHSIGELTAAHVAGMLSLENAAKLVAARGRLMGALPEGGAMVSVRASEQAVRGSLEGFEDRLSIAAVNAPGSVVVSGHAEAADEWAEEVEWKTTRLRVSHAFHSHLMAPMLDEFREVAAGLSFEEPAIPIVSNLTGAIEDMRKPEHWVRHVREAVRFADGIKTLEAAGVTRFLELGPDGVLSALARATVESGDALLAPAMRAKRPEPQAFATFLASAHTHGADVDWSPLTQGGHHVELPTGASAHTR